MKTYGDIAFRVYGTPVRHFVNILRKSIASLMLQLLFPVHSFGTLISRSGFVNVSHIRDQLSDEQLLTDCFYRIDTTRKFHSHSFHPHS
jgi:hypothetical protein